MISAIWLKLNEWFCWFVNYGHQYNDGPTRPANECFWCGKKRPRSRAEDLNCPVCGYYCLGRGGVGCIDKLGIYEKETQ